MTKGKVINREARNEKWYQASVWVGLAVVSLFVLCCTTFHFVREQYTMKYGEYIEADYIESNRGGVTYKVANYVENGKVYSYELDSFNPVVNGDKVKLYYMTYIENAVPQNTPLTWLGDYFFFGAMLAFNIWRIVANYRKPYFMRHQIAGLEV